MRGTVDFLFPKTTGLPQCKHKQKREFIRSTSFPNDDGKKKQGKGSPEHTVRDSQEFPVKTRISPPSV